MTKIEMERFSVISSKPFDTVVATLKAKVGRLDVGELAKTSGRRAALPTWKR